MVLGSDRDELPRGTVTLLFTDIQGSTRLLQALGERYAAVLAEHRARMRACFQAHDGHEFGSEGDAVFVAFGSAGEALAAAAEAQRALAAADWPDGAAVLVRMGLHTGTPMVIDDDYVGLDVHRAARICSAAHGGQVLASDATRALATGIDAAGLGLLDLGWHRLKDLDRPERLHQLTGPGLGTGFDPVRGLPASTNLPTVPTSFVGRAAELAALSALLDQPDVRLVTLTGPGGTGKTRLAIEAGRGLASAFPDGVVFVALAALDDPGMVGLAVLEAIGLRNASGRAALEVAAEHLADRTALLVLDNFEQVAEAASWVGELLARAPGLKVLVTSRLVLNLAGEHELPVRPLAVPGPKLDPEAAMQTDALALFAARARAVRPGFVLDAANAAAVADVCARLDGLPLAIELAAARLRLLSLDELLARLTERLPLLSSRARDLPERQRTLRNAIDWSYQLLEPDDAALLRRLSVFVGGTTLDAVEAVAGPDLPEAFDALTTLVEHSLVYRDDEAEPTRYRMLQTIREFAGGQLDPEEAEATARRHARWFQARALHATVQLDLPDQMVWLAWFDHELDNLRAALAWALAEPAAGDRVVIGAELARALGYLWYTHGQTQEALGWLERITGAPGRAALSVPLRATVLYWYAMFADRRGDSGPAVAALEESAALLGGTDDAGRTARALNALGAMHTGHRDLARARRALEAARLAVAESTDPDDHHTLALVDVNLAAVALERGQVAEARRLMENARAVTEERGDRWAIACVQRDLARIAVAEGDLAGAGERAVSALRAFAEWRDHSAVAETIEIVAGLAAGTGAPVSAARLAGAAGALRAAVGGAMAALDRARLARDLAGARDLLGAERFAAAEAEGANMTFEQAIEYATEHALEYAGSITTG